MKIPETPRFPGQSRKAVPQSVPQPASRKFPGRPPLVVPQWPRAPALIERAGRASGTEARAGRDKDRGVPRTFPTSRKEKGEDENGQDDTARADHRCSRARGKVRGLSRIPSRRSRATPAPGYVRLRYYDAWPHGGQEIARMPIIDRMPIVAGGSPRTSRSRSHPTTTPHPPTSSAKACLCRTGGSFSHTTRRSQTKRLGGRTWNGPRFLRFARETPPRFGRVSKPAEAHKAGSERPICPARAFHVRARSSAAPRASLREGGAIVEAAGARSARPRGGPGRG
jgi:hypothetical protein